MIRKLLPWITLAIFVVAFYYFLLNIVFLLMVVSDPIVNLMETTL